MYILPKCQNPACLYHEKHEPTMLIKKGKDKRKNGKPVQRYQCKACGKQFTTASLTDNHFHKPELLKEIFIRYTSGYSVSRLSQELGISKTTTLRMIEYLAEKTRVYHFELLDSGFLNTDKMYFDEMETFEHSKVYPVSVGIAYDSRSVCAYLRTYTGTMGRRKLNTAKTMKSLRDHFYLMIARYNKYDLNEVLKFGVVQGNFYQDEWTKRIQLKQLKQLIAVLTYPQFLKRQVRIQKLKATWKKKKDLKKLAVSQGNKVA